MKLSYKITLICTFLFLVVCIAFYADDNDQTPADPSNPSTPAQAGHTPATKTTAPSLTATSKTKPAQPALVSPQTKPSPSTKTESATGSSRKLSKLEAFRQRQRAALAANPNAFNKNAAASRTKPAANKPTPPANPQTNPSTNPTTASNITIASKPGANAALPGHTTTNKPATNLASLANKNKNASTTSAFDAYRKKYMNKPSTTSTLASNNTTPTKPAGNLTNKTLRLPKKTATKTNIRTAAHTPTYTVQSGDNLYKISKKVFGNIKYWDEIAKANPNIDPARIHPGDKLKLPNIAKLEAIKRAAASRTTSTRNTNSPRAGSTYKVQSGETLSSISQKFYGTQNRWRDIYNANRKNMSNPDSIQPGMVINIPK